MKLNILILSLFFSSYIFATGIANTTNPTVQKEGSLEKNNQDSNCGSVLSLPHQFGFETGPQGGGFFINQMDGAPAPTVSDAPIPQVWKREGGKVAPIEGSSALYYTPYCCFNGWQTATVESVCFDFSNEQDLTLSFNVLTTKIANELAVEISSDQGNTWSQLWYSMKDASIPKIANPVWINKSLDLGNYLSKNIKIRFRGSLYYHESDKGGNLGLDNIRFTSKRAEEALEPEADCGYNISLPYQNGYESNQDDAIFTRKNDQKWIPRTNSGDDIAPEGQVALYYNDCCAAWGEQSAFIESKCLDLSMEHNVTLSFWSRTSNVRSNLEVEISNNQGVTWTPIWNSKLDINISGGYDPVWQKVNLDLANYLSNSLKIRFKGTYKDIFTIQELPMGLDDIQLFTQPLAEDTTPPTKPTNFTVSDRTESSFRLSWSPSTDNSGNVRYEVYELIMEDHFRPQNMNYIGTFENNTAIITPDSNRTGTDALITVVAIDDAGNKSETVFAIGNIAYKSTDNEGYCIPRGYTNNSFVNNYFISNIQTDAGFSNPSNLNNLGYDDHTDKQINLRRGEVNSFAINITKSFFLNYLSQNPDNVIPNAIIKLFIDYDQDKYITPIYTDRMGAYEQVLFMKDIKVENQSKGIALTFKVPEDAKLGKTRMRIVLESSKTGPSTTLDFCRDLNTYYGEIEDYTVLISDSRSATKSSFVQNDNASKRKEDMYLYPNPSSDFVTVKNNTGTNKNSEYRILNSSGLVVKKGILNDNSIDIREMASGIYFLEVLDESEKITLKLLKK